MALITETVFNPETGEYETYTYDDGSNESGGGIFDYEPADYSETGPWEGWGDAPGEGSSTVVDATTGNITYKYDDGSTLTVGPDGAPVGNTESPDAKGNSAAYNRSLAWATRTFGPTAGKVFSNMMKNPGASLMTAMAAAKAFSGSDSDKGYTKPVPKMDAVREQIEYNDPNRRAGSGGRQYVTDTRYVKEGDTAGLAAAQAANDAQKQGILAAYKPTAAPAVNPYAGKTKTKWNAAPAASAAMPVAGAPEYLDPRQHKTGIAAIDAGKDKDAKPAYDGSNMEPRITQPVGPSYSSPIVKDLENMIGQQKVKYAGADPNSSINIDPNSAAYAHGGIAMLAKGGSPRYLQGETDGMADKIPSRIDGGQEAALSHGEFVIPADVVSHLGNGNSDAGAKKLYQMMDRIREARTGTKQQGKEINPDKFMPGGLAKAYAGGGAVQNFDAGGGVPLDTSKTSGLAPWAGDYVTNMLGKTEALTNTPTAVYKGPLTAGESNLQQQGFAGISDIAATGFDPTKFSTGTFDATQANKYMNPYLSSVLNPQMDELRRQNQITNMGANAKLTSAGAFGGGRQAIMNAENDRNLMQEMNKTVGTGYANAFDKAMAQFNTEQGRQFDVDKASEASRQYSADYGLKSNQDLLNAGATQRAIDAEGIAADKKQFEEQQADPYNRLEFQRKMLTDMPIGMTTSSTNQDAMSKMASDISGLAALYDNLKKLIPTST